MHKQISMLGFTAIFIVLLILAMDLWAQAVTSVRGIVLDPTDALVPGASIVLENLGTSAQQVTNTDKTGGYQFLQLPPGNYRLRVEHAGFKSLVVENLPLTVNTPATLNLRFREIGPISETIIVSASIAPSINSVDATMGNTILNSQIVALPLEARNISGLMSLQPGVLYTGIADAEHADSRGGAVVGARSDQSNLTLDGVDVNDQQTGEPFKSVLPVTLDSVQEFRVVTTNANANQGRSSGGQITLVTRSGSNEFHGSLYEYHRNTVTSANSFFNNSTVDPVTGKTLGKPKLIRNVFGASLGGPVLKNRLFFFFNFEDEILRREDPQLRTVPSQEFRQGILRYLDSAGAVQSVTPQQLQAMDPLGIGPNAKIMELLQQYPPGNDPTQGGDGGLNFVGYRFNAPMEGDKPSYIGRIDFSSPDQRHVFFVRGAAANWKEDEQPQQFPGQPAARKLRTGSKGIAVGHTWIAHPKVVNDFRWGFTRQDLDYTGAVTGAGFELREIKDLWNYSARNNSRKIPMHNLGEDLTWAKGRHTFQFGVNYRHIHSRQVSEDKSYPSYMVNPLWMMNGGMDLLPAGIDEDFASIYIPAQAALLGTISQAEITYFINRDGSIFPAPHIPHREFISNEVEWYVQNQWKAAKNLTITAGLRYSYFAPPYEKNGFQVRADFDVHEWFAARRNGAAHGIPSNENPLLSFVLAGKANHAASFYDPDRNNFAPHLGIAWSPAYSSGLLHRLFGDSGQTSVRIGAAMLYDRTGGTFPITADSGGAVGLSAYLRTPTAEYDYSTAPRFDGIGNLASVPVPPPPAGGFPSTPGMTRNSGFMVDSRLRTPYATTFGISFARELPGSFTVEAAYLGRIGRKLMVQADFAAPLVNFKDPQSGQTWTEAAGVLTDHLDSGTALEQIAPIPFFENVFAPMAADALTATQSMYELASFVAPSWTDLLHYLDMLDGGSTIYGPYTFFQQQFDWLPAWTNMGQSSYHSFQWTVRRRFRNGFQGDFNYSLAKSMDNGSSVESEGQGAGMILNAFDSRQSLSYSDFDVRHQINANFMFDLPVGKGRRFGDRLNPWINAIVGNWEITGLYRWRTGFPFPTASGNGVAFPTNYFVNGPPTLRAGAALPEIRVNKGAEGGPNIFADPEKAYDSFQYTRSGFSGNRNALHGPGFFTIDLGVHKTLKVQERQTIQFRWEIFNLTNTVNFDGRVLPLGNRGIDFNLIARSSFGRLRSLAGTPRIMQFALRYEF